MNEAKFDESQIKDSVSLWRSEPEGKGGKRKSKSKVQWTFGVENAKRWEA